LARLFPNQDYRDLSSEIRKAAQDSKRPTNRAANDFPYADNAANALKAMLYYFPDLLQNEVYRFMPNGQLDSPKTAKLN